MWSREASQGSSGARQPDAIGPALANRSGDERRVVAWVGKFVIFKGNLTSSEDMMIDGRVEGTIELRNHSLIVGADADIRANIIARSVTVRGTVIGTITASDGVYVCEAGSVEGDIISPRLAVAEGAVLRGRVDTWVDHADATNLRPRLVAVV